MRRSWLLWLCLASCLDPQLVPCGDLLCPSSRQCVAGAICATDDQIEACDQVADGESCIVDGSIGICDRGVCVGAGCGNGELDPGETCDDANITSGDGCRADCRKVEVCGDGLLDDGEPCDDGNSNPVDACDACATTRWLASVRGGGDTLATATGLSFPGDVAVDDAGAIYIADSLANRVRVIAPDGTISVLAGTGQAGFAGDQGPAITAQLSSPDHIAVDGLGNVFIADTNNHRVRRVDAITGTISTVAGTGVAAFGGDGVAATGASLAQPNGLAIDGLGNLYIADSGNRRIRRVGPDGIITTIAGTGLEGNSGDGGPAIDATFELVDGIALVDGTLYIADAGADRIRIVDDAGMIRGVDSVLDDPTDVAVHDGVIFVASDEDHQIAAIDGASSAIIAGSFSGFSGDGGPATEAQLSGPRGVAIDVDGGLLVADSGNGRIRKVTAGTIATIAGNGSSGFLGEGGAPTSTPAAGRIAFDLQDRLVISGPSNRVRRVENGAIITIAGNGESATSGDGGPAVDAGIPNPGAIAFDAAGNLAIAHAFGARVRRVDAATGVITTIVGTGELGSSGDGGPATEAQIRSAGGLVFDADGNLYLSDEFSAKVRKIDTAGIITTVAGTGVGGFSGDDGPAIAAQLQNPRGLAIDADGNLYVAEDANRRIRKISPAGIITTFAGTGQSGFSGDGGPATAAAMTPTTLALDATGAMIVGDRGNRRIRRIANGTITTIAGTGGTGFSGDGGPASLAELLPADVALDASGRLAIVDAASARVRRIEIDDTINAIAGMVDPEGMGPLPLARLADPRAATHLGSALLIAGGNSGTLQMIRDGVLSVVAGRYPQPAAAGNRARFRDAGFGTVTGVAVDEANRRIFISELETDQIHVIALVDPAVPSTWTIDVLANEAGIAGFADGAVATARFRAPSGLHFDPATDRLYVADTGNHVIRAIELSAGTVSTVAGTPAQLGFSGDAGLATAARLFAPRAVVRCASGELYIADTGNHRVRRVATTGEISSVLGVGIPASSGEGAPAATFPINRPIALACDPLGNVFATSTTAIRLLPAVDDVVDGRGPVITIYDAATSPAIAARCLTGISVASPSQLAVTDCSGTLIELQRLP